LEKVEAMANDGALFIIKLDSQSNEPHLTQLLKRVRLSFGQIKRK